MNLGFLGLVGGAVVAVLAGQGLVVLFLMVAAAGLAVFGGLAFVLSRSACRRPGSTTSS